VINKKIYFSSLLCEEQKYKAADEGRLATIYGPIRAKRILSEAGSLFEELNGYKIPFGFIANTKDIWVRDFMPVKVRDKAYVSFVYKPSYHKEEEDRKRRTNYRRDLIEKFPLSAEDSEINLDGGNVVFSPKRTKVIISDRVFSENIELYSKEISHNNAILVRELKIKGSGDNNSFSEERNDRTRRWDGAVYK